MNIMAKTPKWNGEQGSADMEKDPLKRDTSARNYSKGRDISRTVDGAQTNDGFSGPLPSKD
jgi:hypothetical protein